MLLGLAEASSLGKQAVIGVSTGNVGQSIIAYARRLGILPIVIYPATVDPAILAAAQEHAQCLVAGEQYDDAMDMAKIAARRLDLPILNWMLRPYYSEGAKTVAFEMFSQAGNDPPGHVVVPAAGATLACSVVLGYQQLVSNGLLPQSPQVHIGQPVGAAPIVTALERGVSQITPVSSVRTRITSLAMGRPGDGQKALRLLRQTNGAGAAVSDADAQRWRRALMDLEGVSADPAAGVALGALKEMIDRGRIDQSDHAAVVVTASGWKSPARGDGSATENPIGSAAELVSRMENLS